MNRIVKILLLVNLAVIAVLVFAYPQLLVAPGKLIPGHRQLEADCFACHAGFTGASSDRCVVCHKPAEIGRLTSAGVPIAKPATATPFHQKLISQDCVACHSDHAGVKRYRTQGRFNHALLTKDTRQLCHTCHESPTDSLHRQMSGDCGQCHSPTAWAPATFDHNKFFELDRDHNTRCATCHVRNDYGRYTCYGCHEHSLDNLRRKHYKEGVGNYDDCVECHRSADEHDIRSGRGDAGGRGEGHHRRGKREHDD
jgi:hypothetical protein